MKKGDIIVITLTIVTAVMLMITFVAKSKSDNLSVKIVYGDTLISQNLPYDGKFEIENNGYHLVIVIEGETVYVQDSDCPDGTCLTMGKIKRSGQFIACVPAGVYIELESKGSYQHEIAG